MFSGAALVVFQLALTVCGQLEPTDTYTHRVTLKEDAMILHWKFSDSDIIFEVHAKTTGWVGIGLSPNGGMAGSDIHIGWVKNEKAEITDRHGPTTGNGYPPKDSEQNIEIVLGQECDGWTLLKFKRELAACESNDKEITSSTMRLIWAYGIADPSGNDITAADVHVATNKGAKSMYFLDAFGVENGCQLPVGPIYETFDMLAEDFALPAVDTYYNCKMFKMPEVDQKHHIVKLEPVITSGNELHVHHIVVYQCDDEANADTLVGNDIPCYGPNMASRPKNCIGSVFGWAIGGTEFCFPDEAGLPFGGENSDMKHLLMEIHYDNPQGTADIIDSSGIRITYTSVLRPNDADQFRTGIPSVGTVHHIPPGAESYLSVGFCAGNCVKNAMDKGGVSSVTVFAGLLHSHLAGRKMRLRHFREGAELPHMLNDDTYDINYQEVRMLQPAVEYRSTDVLRMECVYNTQGRTQMTQGGFATTDEMCLAFMFYYPKIDVAMCVSSADLSVFGFFGIESAVPTSGITGGLDTFRVTAPQSMKNSTVLDVMNSFPWNKSTIDQYAAFSLSRNRIHRCANASLKSLKTEIFPTPEIKSTFTVEPKSCTKTAELLTQSTDTEACSSSEGQHHSFAQSVWAILLFATLKNVFAVY